MSFDKHYYPHKAFASDKNAIIQHNNFYLYSFYGILLAEDLLKYENVFQFNDRNERGKDFFTIMLSISNRKCQKLLVL